MNTSKQLRKTGQAIWFDNIQRAILKDGSLAGMIARGEIYGVTSNPSIFNQAITRSNDYDNALQAMAISGSSAEMIYSQLVMEDIQAAADAFAGLYRESHGNDGYVSIEVNPLHAADTAKMLDEARQIWKDYARPNLMIKVPATRAGIEVVRVLIREGINVNVTLIFTLSQYSQVLKAYQQGLEERIQAGGDIRQVASVASFFVSRVDTRVDKLLQEIAARGGTLAEQAASLAGKAAVANTRLAYELFQQWVNSPAVQNLVKQGARIQRPLWASTGTKNPAYSDVLYVNELVAADTVNTVPPATLKALLDHGSAEPGVMKNLQAAHAVTAELEALGISLEQVGADLEQEGVAIFAEAYQSLLAAIDQKREMHVKRLGRLAAGTASMISRLEKKVEQIWQKDPAAWDQPVGTADISNRLGWLDLPERMGPTLSEIHAFSEEMVREGITDFFVLGMGGSSLAPEVFKLVFPSKLGMRCQIVDSTDPGQIQHLVEGLDPRKSLVIVSSKSGGTSEVKAFFEYFWLRFKEILGEETGKHFIAITDPGTGLFDQANQYGFRRVFLSDPNVGGRFSALTPFGLVPAGLLGVPLEDLIERSAAMERECRITRPAGRNTGYVLGCALAEASLSGRDKLSLLLDEEIRPFGAWLEQLIAESSGKNGKGILPVVEEFILPVQTYGQDRIFVYIRLTGQFDEHLQGLQAAGHPVIVIDLKAKEDLFDEFYRWEFATVVACAALGENAFHQPDVQDNKIRTISKIAYFNEHGRFHEPDLIMEDDRARVFAPARLNLPADISLESILRFMIAQSKPGDYFALNAYLPYTVANTAALIQMRRTIQQRTGLAATSAYGPRFLHSTGQYHKGGPDRAEFLQITSDNDQDIRYGDLTFGQLELAQALGDYESLVERKRLIIRIHLKKFTAANLAELLAKL
jgi:transaldolase/glucose-6-phosphate isomerase